MALDDLDGAADFATGGAPLHIIRGGSRVDDFQIVGATLPQLLAWAKDQPDEVLERRGPGWGHAASWLRPIRNYAQVFGCDPSPGTARALSAAMNLHRWGVLLTPDQLAELEALYRDVTAVELEVMFRHDAFMRNFAKNVWEFAHGATELTSTPWNISLPIADICNARCTFCTSWIEGRGLIRLEQIDAFADVLRRALFIGLVGHGEPMAHPRFAEICERVARYRDPRSSCYTITNGVYLEKWRDQIAELNINSIAISLNAASAPTHEVVMGLGEDAFPRIIESIRHLVAAGVKTTLTLVVTKQNVHELADFVRLGNALGVNDIMLRTLLPQQGFTQGLNYWDLPAYDHPEFRRHRDEAIEAIAASQIPVQAEPHTWESPIFPPAVQHQIEIAPPAFVPREQAMRDRELRRQQDAVYQPDTFARRGRANPAGAETRVLWTKDGALVTTVRGQWQFALAVPLELPSQATGEVSLDIPVRQVKGTLGLGVWDKIASRWATRAFLSEAGTARLAFPCAQGLELVVENATEGGEPASALVGWPTLRLNGEVMKDSCVLQKGVVYSGLDPLDDGVNPLGREAPFNCRAVYYNLYVNEMYMRMVPCCYMSNVPGHEEIRFDGGLPFTDAWNSDAMQTLRGRLREGPLFGACQKCPETW